MKHHDISLSVKDPPMSYNYLKKIINICDA